MDRPQDSSDDEVEIVHISTNGMQCERAHASHMFNMNQELASNEAHQEPLRVFGAGGPSGVQNAGALITPASPIHHLNGEDNAAVPLHVNHHITLCIPTCPHAVQQMQRNHPRIMIRGTPRHQHVPYHDVRRLRTAPVYAPHQSLWLRQHADLERRRQSFVNQNNPRPTATVQQPQNSSADAEIVSRYSALQHAVASFLPEPSAEAHSEAENSPQFELTCNVTPRHYNAFENLVRAILRSSCAHLPMDSVSIQTTIDCAWSAMENSYRHIISQSIPEDNIIIFPGATFGMINSYTSLHTYAGIGNDDKCMVCINNIRFREQIRKLPCNHIFHQSCIDKWLSICRMCPICRRDIRPLLESLLNTVSE